jgi:chemotaxis protein MotB
MSRRRRHKGHVSHERWLVSYADFITLLFALFVVLYAASQVDNKRIGQISQAIQNAFQELGVFQEPNAKRPAQGLKALASSNRDSVALPGASKEESDNLKNLLQTALAPEISKKQAELRDGPDGMVISLREIGFYDQGSDVLKQASTDTLNRVAAVLKPAQLRVRIEGHTDNIPIHNARFASNWELSAARATGLVRIFVERYQFDAARLSAAGYAEYHPIEANDTAEGRSQNRRVDIVVLDAGRHSGRELDLGRVQPATAELVPQHSAPPLAAPPSSGH